MSTEKNLVGVILAAGRGTRIKPLSLRYPKPLLPVCNKPIIQYQIEDMKRIGVKEVFVVVGHLKEKVPQQLGDGSAWGMKLHYIDQGETLGIAHAVLQLEDQIDSPFILFLGDIFMVNKDLQTMVEMFWARQAGGVLAVKREYNPEYIRRNFAVILHASGIVTRVIEKPRYVNTDLKGCGIYLFDQAIFDAIRRTPRTAQRDEYEITSSIQILIDDGYPVYPAEVVKWDMNITLACDLLGCNRRQRERLGQDNIVGQNVRLAPGTQVINSVIGDGVTVSQPITIRDSLLFAGTPVTGTEDIVDTVMTPDDVIVCRGR
ncbi:MAG: NTP transferase domain-containing protein [Chloroflexi bacterium]|nr:NTP transferase domain-containing protein [Chloroflexota bacterium]